MTLPRRPVAIIAAELPDDIGPLLPGGMRRSGRTALTHPLELPEDPFDLASRHIVIASEVGSQTLATDLLRCAARGVHLVLRVDLPPPVAEGFLDDLARVADVSHLAASQEHGADTEERVELDPEQVRFLRLLASGMSVSQAGRESAMSRRTAYRRVGEIMVALHTESPDAAVRVASARGLISGRRDSLPSGPAHSSASPNTPPPDQDA